MHHSDRIQSYGTQQSAFGALGGLASGGGLSPQFGGIVQIPTSAVGQPNVGQPSFSSHFTVGGGGGNGSESGPSGAGSGIHDQRHM